jgi:hypothetical protein
VSETCDRSSLETRINYSLHRLFTSPTAADGVDRQRVTVRGSGLGFGVRGVAARRRGGPGPKHGREVLVVTSRTSKYQERNAAAGKGRTTSPPGKVSRYIVSRYIPLHETASGRDGANGRVSAVSAESRVVNL